MPVKVYSRPRDRSLQAFKEWIEDMTHRLNPNVEDTIAEKQRINEEQWIDNWKKFWAKVDSGSTSQKSSEE